MDKPRTLGDLVDEAKVLALAEVLEPTEEGFLRTVCRLYSEKWHTPLHVVERDVPLIRVLQAYFESAYENMEEPDRDALVEELLLTPEAREAARLAEDEDDEAFMREANEEAETLAGAAQDLAGKLGKLGKVVAAKSGKTPRVPMVMESDPDLPPSVSVSFVDEIPDDDEGLGLLDDPKK